ncbi:TonB-dependent receptor [Derxia lacustris]|uniref:TonB-dependent receptor n=1 Tax=Derxia lacustris TaxID=764842 RepID=UPI001F238212|nr:TonB-dependent receptor [Derxia lacustris]
MKQRISSAKQPRSLRLRNGNGALSGAALGLSAAMLAPLTAQAQSSEDAASQVTMPVVKVQSTRIDPNPNAEVGVPYKAKTSGDARHTRPLAETPQTISVITKEAIDDSGATSLTAILDAQPGITLGTGENGNAFGDRYIIRGQEARSDVFVDGLRDPGMTTRESFAIEQLEISKGPNSSFAGRGTAGGAINAITKQATLDYDFTRLGTGVGTDDYRRITLDANKVVTDELALRVNALWGDEDVPGRAPASRSRKGLALSAFYEVSPTLGITLDYYGLRAKDAPDLGSYMVGSGTQRKPYNRAPVYVQEADFLKSNVDTVTARVKWDIAPATHLTSSTRFGQTQNGYVVTGASANTIRAADGSTYTAATLNDHSGWQEVSYFAHQTNLRHDTSLAGMKHELIGSVEFTDHKVDKGGYSIVNAGATNCSALNARTGAYTGAWCVTDANGNAVNGVNSLLDRQITKTARTNDWHIRTVALSAMDTVDITDKLSAFGGLRLDRFDWSLGVTTLATGVRTAYSYSDTLVNSHLGLTYKLTPQGMVYASIASAADINGGEADAGTSSGYGGVVLYNGSVAGAKPEKSKNLELGSKWNLFDNKLLATAAVFQTTKRDVMEGANYDTVGTFNTGKNRVHGVELGLVGNISDDLTTQLGAAFMKSRVLESATASNVGKVLSNFADKSAFAQVKYRVVSDVSVGSSAKYESSRCAGQPDTAAGITNGICSQLVPSYSTYDFFATYRVNKNLDLRLNVLNAFNRDYYLAAYRSGSFVYKGDARAVRLTLNYEL